MPPRCSSARAAFDNAREPLAQAFKPHGRGDADDLRRDRQPLQVQGLRHRRPHRPGQRQPGPRRAGRRRCSTSPTTFKADRGIDKLFLTGDFNAYSDGGPDPGARGRAATPTWSPTRPTSGRYNFGGHGRVAGPRLRQRRGAGRRRPASTSGTSTPTSRSPSSTAATTTTRPTSTRPNQFRASDHDPEIVGIDVPGLPRRAPRRRPSRARRREGDLRPPAAIVHVTRHAAADADGHRHGAGGRAGPRHRHAERTAPPRCSLGKHAPRPGRHQLTVTLLRSTRTSAAQRAARLPATSVERRAWSPRRVAGEGPADRTRPVTVRVRADGVTPTGARRRADPASARYRRVRHAHGDARAT